MTLAKPPGSIEQALDRISGVIAWPEMAAIVGRAESTVRNWANPTTEESVPLTLAVQLDLAWQRAGQLGAPLLNAHMALADRARVNDLGCQLELTRGVALLARENGQAEEAALLATLPGADDTAFALAEREVNDAVAQATGLLGMLRRLRRTRAPP